VSLTPDGDRVRGPAATSLSYQPALDGLRGIAVATVLLYHAGVPWMIGGYLGVSTFFTLSGFLITSLLLAEHARTGRIHLAAFWERRFRRIMPAALAALCLALVFGAFAADAYQREHLRGDTFATLGYVVNWWFIVTRRDYADIFGSPSPVQHFWSLAIEEQFYLAFPLLTALVLRSTSGSRRALAGVLAVLAAASASLLIAWAPTDVPTARLYYGTDTRAAELLAGALLAIALGGGPRFARGRAIALVTALGVAGLATSAFFWVSVHQEDIRLYRGGLACYALASVAVLAAAVAPGGPVRRVLSIAPLRWLGRVSYGVYLYHFPVYLWLTAERTGLGDAQVFALRIGVTLVLALASYHWLEWPIRSGRRILAWRRWVLPPLAASTIALACVVVTAGAASTAAVVATPVRATGPMGHGRTRILVVGDSVANGIALGLGRWAVATGRSTVLAHARSGCGVAGMGDEIRRDAQVRAANCQRWIDGWTEKLDSFRPDVVVVYTGGWDLAPRRLPEWEGAREIGDPAFDRWLGGQFETVVERLASRGARVVWLNSLCVKKPPLGAVGVFDPRRIAALNQVIGEVSRAEDEHMTLIDLFSVACPRGTFTNTLHGIENARPDGIHFAPPAADWIASWLGPQLLREHRKSHGGWAQGRS
jgi:peptidoglycan/LPS O-acetylase OafA/YrhL